VCCHDGQYICFNPIYCPQEQWLEVQSFTSTRELISWVYNSKIPIPIYYDVCIVIAKTLSINLRVLEIPAEAWPGRKLICQMISTCAGETTLGHVVMQAVTTTHTGVVFHGLPGKRQNPSPFFRKE
jgi:hypothetical protein